MNTIGPLPVCLVKARRLLAPYERASELYDWLTSDTQLGRSDSQRANCITLPPTSLQISFTQTGHMDCGWWTNLRSLLACQSRRKLWSRDSWSSDGLTFSEPSKFVSQLAELSLLIFEKICNSLVIHNMQQFQETVEGRLTSKKKRKAFSFSLFTSQCSSQVKSNWTEQDK